MSFAPLNEPQTAFALGIVGLLAGYVGADIAPDTLIERMLWPQRAYNDSTLVQLLKTAPFLPAGGPLQHSARKTLDAFFKHSLHKGAGRGHMLGTAFFPDTGLEYKLYPGNGRPVEQELVRNGLLVRALQCLPSRVPLTKGKSISVRRMRQQITVSQLELFNLEDVWDTPSSKAIALHAGNVSAKTILALFASEILAMTLCLFVAAIGHPFASVLFIVPLLLKVAAALTTIQREDLHISTEREKSGAGPDTPKFEIFIPGEGFQVISGPADLILPFFRHYGHPIRCRWREVIQMLVVGLMGMCFPLSLAFSLLCTPVRFQAIWVGYQVYVTMAMLYARYGGGESWGTTEERVAKALARAERYGEGGMVTLKNQTGQMIGARLTRTVHESYGDGKAEVSRITKA